MDNIIQTLIKLNDFYNILDYCNNNKIGYLINKFTFEWYGFNSIIIFINNKQFIIDFNTNNTIKSVI